MKELKPKDFVGKTIASINTNSVNCVQIKFTDGTSQVLEPQRVEFGLYGIFAWEDPSQYKE